MRVSLLNKPKRFYLFTEDVAKAQLLVLRYDGPLMNTTHITTCYNQTENLADLLEDILINDCDDWYATRFGCVELVDTP